MISILLLAAALVGSLVLLLARYAPPMGLGRWRPGSAHDGRPLMPETALRALSVQLLGALGLSLLAEESDERFLVATKQEPFGELRYLVALAAASPNGVVDQAAVVALAQDVKGEGAAVGMLITPGEIETAGLAGLDAKLELIDGSRFRTLIAQHLPSRLREVDRYRGFGADVKGEAIP
jgi:hypothetical protein